ncbi:lysozyme inhibitor LprI family protein [Psychrobacter glacincola]|uniref:lysozyme inhibitor LprI family protein n=1 Tax=Psychrobacter glacincola TaxID=56810 RepID=UPI0039B00D24
MFIFNLNKSSLPTYQWLWHAILLSSLMLATSVSSAVTPVKANFILGMDVQGQRLNLYRDCKEGSVTCDNMLLVAPDLGRLLQTKMLGKREHKSPYTVKLYPAKTKHSLCKDGITPCGFQGYSFKGEDVNGFIDQVNNEIYIESNRTKHSATFSYRENSTYLPLVSQAGLIDRLYQNSDKELNRNYLLTRRDIIKFYGQSSANDFKENQRKWVVERSQDCGADAKHLPRNQAEKVCFIQKNNEQMESYFLWID